MHEAKVTPFTALNSLYPLHSMLAQMTAKDGIPFLKFKSSQDLRLAIEARMLQINCKQKLPESEKTIHDYVMLYGEKSKEIVKRVKI